MDDGIQELFVLLRDYANLPKPETSFKLESGMSALAAWPVQKIAIVTSSDALTAFRREGWSAERLPGREVRHLDALAGWMRDIGDLLHRGGSGPSASLSGEPVTNRSTIRAFMRMLDAHTSLGKAKLNGGTFIWEDHQFAITPSETLADKYRAKGWQAVVQPSEPLAHVGSILVWVEKVRLWAVVAEADAEAKSNISKAEAQLLRAVLDVGLPEPDRNRVFYWPNGEVATKPDLCWEDARLVIELDGYYFHKGRHLDEGLRAAVKGDAEKAKKVSAKAQDRAIKDAAKRRLLGEQGWAVYVVHDVELDGESSALEIARTIRTIRDERLRLLA